MSWKNCSSSTTNGNAKFDASQNSNDQVSRAASAPGLFDADPGANATRLTKEYPVATIAINLDDQATEGLHRLTETIGDLGDQTEETAAQIDEVNRSTEVFKSFGRSVADAGSKFNDFINRGHDTATNLKVTGINAEDASGKFERFKGVLAQTAAGLLAPVSGLWDLKQELLGLPIIAGVTVGTLVKLKETSGEVAEVTEKSAASHASWAATAAKLGLKLSAVTAGTMAATSAGSSLAGQARDIRDANEKSADSFDQLKSAAGGAAYALLRPFEEAGPAMRDFTGYLNDEVGNALDSFRSSAMEKLGITDELLKRSAEGLKGWGTFFENWVDEARGNFVRYENAAIKALGFKGDQQGRVDGYADEAKQLRELADIHARLDSQREKEKAGFESIREVNEKLQKAQDSRARAAVIAALDSEEAINREIRAVRVRAGEEAQAGKDAAEIADKLLAEVTALENQRVKVASGTSDKIKEIRRAEARASEEADNEAWEEYVRLNRERMKAEEDRAKHRAELAQQSGQHVRDIEFDEAQARIKDDMARLEREEAGEQQLHQKKLELIRSETEFKIASAKTDMEVEQARHDGVRRLAQEESQFERDQAKAKAQAVKDAESLYKKEIEAARKKFQELASMHEQQGGTKGVDLVQGLDQRAVLRDIQKRRGDAARKQVASDEGDIGDDPAAKRRLKALQERAAKKAEAEAFREAKSGKMDTNEIATSQVNVGNKTLQGLQKQGKIGFDTAGIVAQQLEAASQQLATATALENRIKQLEQGSKLLLGKAQQQRRQAQGGG
jgi:hypothetical protein